MERYYDLNDDGFEAIEEYYVSETLKLKERIGEELDSLVEEYVKTLDEDQKNKLIED